MSETSKIAAAISAVMGDVPKLGKSEKNVHGNYQFASIDDFLEAVRPLCAKHGLIIIQDEDGFELRQGQDKKGSTVNWLVIKFVFTLAHSSGEVWPDKPRRTIMVNASMGAQAFGAAQSYALKQFMRALFQIATGEVNEDADAHDHGELPHKDSRSADWIGPLNKTELKNASAQAVRNLQACDDMDTYNAYITSPEWLSLIGQMEKDTPHWLYSTQSDKRGLQDWADEIAKDLTEKAAQALPEHPAAH